MRTMKQQALRKENRTKQWRRAGSMLLLLTEAALLYLAYQWNQGLPLPGTAVVLPAPCQLAVLLGLLVLTAMYGCIQAGRRERPVYSESTEAGKYYVADPERQFAQRLKKRIWSECKEENGQAGTQIVIRARAGEQGGGFYDVFAREDDSFLFWGCVQGEGWDCIVMTKVIKTLVRILLLSGKAPEKILSELNVQLGMPGYEEIQATLFIAVLNRRTGNLRYANAGEAIPFLQRKTGKFHRMEMDTGAPLNGAFGNVYWGDYAYLHREDRIFCCNRTLLEQLGGDMEQASGRLQSLLQPVEPADPELAMEDMEERIEAAVKQEGKQEDQIRILLYWEGEA